MTSFLPLTSRERIKAMEPGTGDGSCRHSQPSLSRKWERISLAANVCMISVATPIMINLHCSCKIISFVKVIYFLWFKLKLLNILEKNYDCLTGYAYILWDSQAEEWFIIHNMVLRSITRSHIFLKKLKKKQL